MLNVTLFREISLSTYIEISPIALETFSDFPLPPCTLPLKKEEK